jgi:uncharacterized membrane protein YphA (DoxX/SURF4 family)
MDAYELAPLLEAILRIVLGLRFLYSGVSNIIRWPHAIGTARVVFPVGAPFFGFMGVLFMTVGGLGLALGVQTQVCALMIALFLLPTFVIHVHWRRLFPAMVADLASAIRGGDLRPKMQYIGKHAVHAHDVGWQDNLVFFVLALYFAVRPDTVLALGNVLS